MLVPIRLSPSLRLLVLASLAMGGALLPTPSATAHARVIQQAGLTEQSVLLSQLFSKGRYDEAITQATTFIKGTEGQGGTLDPYVYYWRGRAEYSIGWFGQAKRDMALAIQAGVQVQGESPQRVIARVQAMEAVLPSGKKEIGQGDLTYFRAHYNPDDPTAQLILQALPTAYRVNATMYGTDVSNQLILIFDTPEQLNGYLRARGGNSEAARYALAFSDGAALVFCSWKLKDYSALEIAGTVTHEYNHCVLRRAMGEVELPSWFTEGIAEAAKSQVVQLWEERNDRDIARLVASNSLVLPRRLEKHDSFMQQTNAGLERNRAGQASAASPYAQGFHMTRFLLSNIEKGQLPTFLNQVRELGSLDKALQNKYRLTLPQFYNLWYEDLKKKVQGQ